MIEDRFAPSTCTARSPSPTTTSSRRCSSSRDLFAGRAAARHARRGQTARAGCHGAGPRLTAARRGRRSEARRCAACPDSGAKRGVRDERCGGLDIFAPHPPEAPLDQAAAHVVGDQRRTAPRGGRGRWLTAAAIGPGGASSAARRSSPPHAAISRNAMTRSGGGIAHPAIPTRLAECDGSLRSRAMRAIDVRHKEQEKVICCWEVDGLLIDPGPGSHARRRCSPRSATEPRRPCC